MNWSEIPWSPTSRTLRQFAGLWLGCFVGLACWHAWQHNAGWAWAFAGLAFAAGPLGLLKPRMLRPIFVASMVLTCPVGWLIARLALACLFYGLFTPLGLWFRFTGRDLLGLRFSPERTTYWTAKPASQDPRRYFQPF
jgi:hypothetical protein